MDAKVNRILLSRTTFHPEKNLELPEMELMELPGKYEKVGGK